GGSEAAVPLLPSEPVPILSSRTGALLSRMTNGRKSGGVGGAICCFHYTLLQLEDGPPSGVLKVLSRDSPVDPPVCPAGQTLLFSHMA
uniref:Uncharacterized protein n=1 Tax=Oryzias melastigma TaxID=30732 RepID=A0A3B3CWW2_ORYME